MNNCGKYGPLKQPPAMGRELAKRVVSLRKEKGYSQVELARRSGVSLSSLRRFEQTGKVSLNNLLHISQPLGRMIDFDDLLGPIDDVEKFCDRLFDRTKEYYDNTFSKREMDDEGFKTVLRALSIGDAFGAGVEFQDRDWIRDNVDFTRFVNARDRIKIEEERRAIFTKNYHAWDYTDDTEMTVGILAGKYGLHDIPNFMLNATEGIPNLKYLRMPDYRRRPA